MRHFGLILLLAASPAACWQGDPARTSYQQFRYDEDWSFLADNSLRVDWLDPLKYIRLRRNGWYATLGGEARERFELLDRPSFGAGPADTNGYFLQRYLLSVDLHFGPRIRVFGELQSGLENGRNGGPRATDAATLNVHQAFVDWNLYRSESTRITLRAGRQELGFGSGRLISPAEGLNLRRSLDGLRLTVTRGHWVWNATSLRLVRVSPGFFQDQPDHTQTYWGFGVVTPHPLWPGAHVSFHYHGLDKKDAIFQKRTGRAVRHTAGVRVWRAIGAWDFNYEALGQWGTFTGEPIRAWALSADTGYSVTGVRFRPRFAVRSDITSGDGGVSSHTLGSFDPLFPAIPVYSGPSGVLGPTNLVDLTPSVRFRLGAAVALTVESSSFWRESLRDGVYGASGIPLRPGESSGSRYVATAPSVTIAWPQGRHASCSMIYTHFLTGQYFREALPDRNINYVAATVSYRF